MHVSFGSIVVLPISLVINANGDAFVLLYSSYHLLGYTIWWCQLPLNTTMCSILSTHLFWPYIELSSSSIHDQNFRLLLVWWAFSSVLAFSLLNASQLDSHVLWLVVVFYYYLKILGEIHYFGSDCEGIDRATNAHACIVHSIDSPLGLDFYLYLYFVIYHFILVSKL
jgi:hypothetical protein